ncbi:MAG: VCBS repeat-containing protein [Phycisphaerae bacterium]|nr:VCBS repeat-containing protein [Phycisphaerae bacterium]MCZ2398804.1 VCBS repeat-containing protein [Phycisphaerae bacterium]
MKSSARPRGRNTGNGTFAPHVTYATGKTPDSVAIADLDNDGDADLAVTNQQSANVSVLSNNGNGMFAAQLAYATGSWPNFVATADLNGDGRFDLAVANGLSHDVAILLNICFSAPPCPGDLNADGQVGQGDLGILLAAYGLNGDGDLDGDGDTDQADLGILLAHYGELCS